MNTLDAMHQRRACRAFLDTPVSREQIETVLEAARWAPSGVNMQPWQVVVLQGQTQAALSQALIEVREADTPPTPDYAYYPDQWLEPYKSRRKDMGLTLYSALGIGREDSEAQKQSWYNNYRFFGAPVALLFFIDRDLNQGSWLDLGMFVENVMLAAVDQGLATCPQASIADYPDAVRDILNIPADKLLACGMSLGYADPQHAANSFRIGREAVADFTVWYD